MAITCLRASRSKKVRDLVTDLQLIKGTRGIISLLSAREPVLNHEIIRGKLLSEDGQLMLRRRIQDRVG